MTEEEEQSEREIRASHRMMEVTEWELQRILLDIHDGPVQYMYAALSQLDLLRRAVGRSPVAEDPEVRLRMGRIRQLLESGLGEVRSFIGAFRPPEFEARELFELLESLVLQHESATDTEVALSVDSELPRVALPVKIALYRVLQEGLSNAYRHGGADHVRVTLSGRSGRGAPSVRMEIEDNGAGFDLGSATREEHFGLKGMRDRIEMIGGCFEITSSPGEGADIRLEVPAR